MAVTKTIIFKSAEQVRAILRARVRIDKDGCWLLGGNPKRYPRIEINGQKWRGNRISYTVFKGEILPDMFICHSCDKRSCINPDHLWQGSDYDNKEDSFLKKRAARGKG